MGTFGTQIKQKREIGKESQNLLLSLSASDAQWHPSRIFSTKGYENRSCVWSPDGSYIAWSCGQGCVKAVPWNPAKNCLLTDDDSDLDGSPLNHRRKIRTFNAGSQVYCLAFGFRSQYKSSKAGSRYHLKVSADDLILAVGLKNGCVRLWNVQTGEIVLVLLDHTAAIHDTKFAPDGSMRLLSASLDGSLKLWDIEDDGNMSHTFHIGSSPGMMGCCWSPDGRMICGVGTPRSVVVWDVESQTCRQFRGHLNTVCSCAFSKDGFFLITASFDTMAIIWNVQSGNIVQKLCHLYPLPKEWLLGGFNNSHIRDLALSPNGHHAVTVCDDCIVRVWDLLSPDTVYEVGIVSEALCCTYSPGGSCIAVGKSDGGLQIFEAPLFDISLQSLCRFAIQHHLKQSNYSSEQKQSLFNTLPPALQAFLNYENVITFKENESVY